MPDLNTTFHVDMLRRSKVANSLPVRLIRALRRDLYGIEWGDPDIVEPLRYVRDHYLKPYVNAWHTALEIGPGGGRWTRYMLGFKQMYVVDYYPQLLEELRKNFKQKHIIAVKNNGADFPGIPDQSVDFVFSFCTFVHLEPPIIEQYLQNLRRVIRPAANSVIHYSDMTKIMARENKGFSQNTPREMRRMVLNAGYCILEEDLTTMWHSSLVRFSTMDRGLSIAG
jgi:SAM-dependent methyltransferase